MMFQHPKVKEEDLLNVVGKIANRLADGYTFGIYNVDDIKQEIYIIVLERDKKGKSVLDRWDGQHPLYKFLLHHVSNRLNNLKRNKWFRASCPCKKCDGKENGATSHKNKKHCKRFIQWKTLNSSKANLAGPSQLSEDYDISEEKCHLDIMVSEELIDFIDERLPTSIRANYLKLRSGIKISDIDKDIVMKEVKQIVEDFNAI
jgi:hypothetical protein